MNIWEAIIEIAVSKKFYIPVITFLIAIIIINLINRFVKKVIIRKSNKLEIKRKNTIISLIQNMFKYVLLTLALLITLDVWEINISGIVAGLGIAGVVAGLAIQDALKDIIMGCNIILDNYFVVGDIVKIDDFTGEVIAFGLKNTKIKNVDGTVLIIANREISKVYNVSQKNSTVIVKIPVAYEEKEENVKRVLQKVIDKLNHNELSIKKPMYLGIDEFTDSSVMYMIHAFCEAGNQHTFKRQIYSMIKNEFDKENIKIPYPQLEVHNGKKL